MDTISILDRAMQVYLSPNFTGCTVADAVREVVAAIAAIEAARSKAS